VSISKAADARTGKPKALPKTANAVREVPIDATLVPVLAAMHERQMTDSRLTRRSAEVPEEGIDRSCTSPWAKHRTGR
jgi:hypothetical protein